MSIEQLEMFRCCPVCLGCVSVRSFRNHLLKVHKRRKAPDKKWIKRDVELILENRKNTSKKRRCPICRTLVNEENYQGHLSKKHKDFKNFLIAPLGFVESRFVVLRRLHWYYNNKTSIKPIDDLLIRFCMGELSTEELNKEVSEKSMAKKHAKKMSYISTMPGCFSSAPFPDSGKEVQGGAPGLGKKS